MKGVNIIMRLKIVMLVCAIVLLIPGVVFAAPSYLGPSGLITIPDDRVVGKDTLSVAYHGLFRDKTINAFSGNFGLLDNLEVGVTAFTGDGSDLAFNGKYRIVSEAPDRPSVLVGVTDATGARIDSHGSVYILLGKNITSFASNVANEQSRPLRAILGAGSGFYDGVFAGLDWTLDSKLSAMLEYTRKKITSDESDSINLGIRYAATPGLRLDAATLNFEDFAAGISYTTPIYLSK